jgi:hypothetical protein
MSPAPTPEIYSGIKIPPTVIPSKTGDFRFAMDYSIGEIIKNFEGAASFEREYIRQEAHFFAIARNPSSMLSYDGWNLNKESGIPDTVRYWSAPSKESLDIALCIKAITGDERARLLFADGDEEKTEMLALQVLKGKLDSYNSFYERYPGYGGFLPWFLAGAEMVPTDDWTGEIPGLDNGEWAWAMLAIEYVLGQQGYQDLADEYAEYNQRLKENAVKIFFDESAGKVRGDVKVGNTASVSSSYETIIMKPGRMTYLTEEHGVHEGFMMVMFVTLFGKGLTRAEKDTIWNGISMVRVEHKYGTTWQAYWGSAHESWAWLFLPFRDLPEYRQLFSIREIIRTNDARERGFTGFPSSTNKPGDTGYLSDAGIQGIGSQECANNHVFAIYGDFPLLLEFSEAADDTAGNIGLAWLLNMLQAPRMQGPLGGGESSMHDGSAVSYVKTIDGTFPVLLALMGGVSGETAAMLHKRGIYDEFINIITKEYDEAFGRKPLKEPVGFVLPGSTVPQNNWPDYDYHGESYKVRHFDMKFRKAIRPLLETYGWKSDGGTIEEGDISYFYEHYENLWELEQYLGTKPGKELNLYPTPPEPTSPPLHSTNGRSSLSLMPNWKLGAEGRGGWGTDGTTRESGGTIHIPGSGWTGETVEPPVSIEGRSYIGIKGKGEFLIEVKNMSDRAFIPKVRVRLSPGRVVYVDIPSSNRNDAIMVIAITDYTQDVYIEDIFITDNK